MTLSDLSDPMAVKAAMQEFDRIGRTAFLKKYGFGKFKEYMIWNSESGGLYDSKAIAGVAHGYQFPDKGPLKPTQFAGGEATVEPKLKKLGFEIVHIGADWTASEVEAVVSDYFEMLGDERAGKPYNKSHHNEALRKTLKAQTRASIELKHQNISAILEEVELPYVEGYKPRHNYQTLLRDTVLQFIKKRGNEIVRRVIDVSDISAVPDVISDWKFVQAAPPKPQAKIGGKTTSAKRHRLPKKLDYAGRDEQNRALGEAGEKWVIEWERKRLEGEGRGDLAQTIDWVSQSQGDGTGYDIRSFNVDGTVRYIEVKTTNGPIRTPFLISRNEVRFSKEESESFFLYRVFDFLKETRLYILQGDVAKTLTLEPQEYRASPK